MLHSENTRIRLAACLWRGLRLLAWPLLALAGAACGSTSTVRHPASAATEVILRFSYDDGKPMRHDNYLATARQQLWIRQCSSMRGVSTCEVRVEPVFMAGGSALDANGEVRVTLRSTGPIGDHASQRCINGKAYVFDAGNWTRGPFSPGQVIEIRYAIREIRLACPVSSATPPWWPQA